MEVKEPRNNEAQNHTRKKKIHDPSTTIVASCLVLNLRCCGCFCNSSPTVIYFNFSIFFFGNIVCNGATNLTASAYKQKIKATSSVKNGYCIDAKLFKLKKKWPVSSDLEPSVSTMLMCSSQITLTITLQFNSYTTTWIHQTQMTNSTLPLLRNFHIIHCLIISISHHNFHLSALRVHFHVSLNSQGQSETFINLHGHFIRPARPCLVSLGKM